MHEATGSRHNAGLPHRPPEHWQPFCLRSAAEPARAAPDYVCGMQPAAGSASDYTSCACTIESLAGFGSEAGHTAGLASSLAECITITTAAFDVQHAADAKRCEATSLGVGMRLTCCCTACLWLLLSVLLPSCRASAAHTSCACTTNRCASSMQLLHGSSLCSRHRPSCSATALSVPSSSTGAARSRDSCTLKAARSGRIRSSSAACVTSCSAAICRDSAPLLCKRR